MFGFGKKQKEWRTHDWKSRYAFVTDMHRARKQMSKKQFKEYERRITENVFMKQVDEHMRSKGATVQINPNSPKLRKFVIG